MNSGELGDLIVKNLEKTWTESKKWPNHSKLEVEVTWLLNTDGTVTPKIKCHPVR